MSRTFVKVLVILLTGFLAITACKKKVKTEIVEVPSAPGRPSVVSMAVDSLSSTSVVLSGQITREGNGDVSAAGFCWSDGALPTIDETPTNYQFPASHFRYRLTGLKPGTTYSFRAFATNDKGTGYGETVSFETQQGWKRLDPNPNQQIRQFTSIISTGTKLAGISFNGIYVSADNGLTWFSNSNNLMGNATCLANIGETLFAGTSNGVYASTNGGTSWIPATNGLSTTDAVNYLHAHNNYLFAATQYSLFRSANNGQNWSVVTFSNTFDYVQGIASQGNSLFVLKGYNTYQSEDNGSTWTAVTSNQNFYINQLQGTTSGLIALGAQQLYYSSDKAKTWMPVNLSGYFSQAVTSGSNAAVYSYNDVYISTNGGASWINNDGGLDATVSSLVFHKNYILASTYNGFYKLVLN